MHRIIFCHRRLGAFLRPFINITNRHTTVRDSIFHPLRFNKSVAVQFLRRLPINLFAYWNSKGSRHGVWNICAILQLILDGDIDIALLLRIIISQYLACRMIYNLKADGIAGLQNGILRNRVNQRAVDKAGIKVAALVIQRTLCPEFAFLFPNRDVKLLRSENLLPICRDRFFAVGMFHPQAQGHSLRLGIRKILYNGAQLNLLPLHAAIIKAVFTAAA